MKTATKAETLESLRLVRRDIQAGDIQGALFYLNEARPFVADKRLGELLTCVNEMLVGSPFPAIALVYVRRAINRLDNLDA